MNRTICRVPSRSFRDARSVQRAELETLADSWLNSTYGVAPYEWLTRGFAAVLFESCSS